MNIKKPGNRKSCFLFRPPSFIFGFQVSSTNDYSLNPIQATHKHLQNILYSIEHKGTLISSGYVTLDNYININRNYSITKIAINNNDERTRFTFQQKQSLVFNINLYSSCYAFNKIYMKINCMEEDYLF